MRYLLLVTVFTFVLPFTVKADIYDDVMNFEVKGPSSSELTKSHDLWATYYYIPTYDHKENTYPLLDLEGEELGASLIRKNWCYAGIEGTVAVKKDGVSTVFNYAGRSEELQVNCADYFPRFPATGRIRWKVSEGPYGEGTYETDYILFPYRSIAVDKRVIAYGTVLYIPAAVGIEVKLKSGRTFTHDGYFFAADKGGGIKGNHIDVFQGFEVIKGFEKFVKSRPSGKFRAYVVENSKLQKALDYVSDKNNEYLRGDEF